MQICKVCKQTFDLDQWDNWFKLTPADWNTEFYICSASCLCDIAWQVKQSQTKLSKSHDNRD